MEQHLVLANVALAVLALVYAHRREGGEVALHWAGAWLVLLATGVLVSLPGPPLAARVAAHASGVALGMLLLTGALAFAGLRRPRWLLGAGLGLAATSALLPLLSPSPVAYVVAPFLEGSPVVAAAAVVWRARERGSIPESLLGPALLAFAAFNVVDGSVRALGLDTLPLVIAWLAPFGALLLLQIACLVERGLARERGLSEDLAHARRLESLGRMAGGLAHDLGNQLTVIIGNAALLRDGLQGDSELQDCTEELEQSALQCADGARELLSFARECAGEPRPVEVAALVRDVERWLRPRLAAGARLEIDVARETPPALADPNQLRRVLVHLLENARQAAGEEGSVSLRVAPRSAQPLSGRTPGAPRSWLILEVQDDGGGMDEASQDRAFDPFLSGMGERGAGLGLSFVYGAVRAHGGSIEMESRSGSGTTFRLTWPAAPTSRRLPGWLRPERKAMVQAKLRDSA